MAERRSGVDGLIPSRRMTDVRPRATDSLSRGYSPKVMRYQSRDSSTMPAQRPRASTAEHRERAHRPKPTVSQPSDLEPMPLRSPLPSDDVLSALFDQLMNRMHLPPGRVAELNTRSREHKWSLILAQHEVQTGIACVFYIEQLVRHTQPELKERRPRKKLLEKLQPLTKVLTDLEVDLRTNPNDSWVHEFVSTPNHGHVALIDLIKDLADNPYSVPRKNPHKYAVLERDPSLLYTSLLCLKALMNTRQGFSAILSNDPSLCVLVYCLSCNSSRVQILIMKLMVTVLLAPGGHRKVMQAFNYYRAVMKERTRFQLLVAYLTQEPVDPAFQASALCFINTVVQTAQGTNAKVFYQHEFIEAGFDPAEVERTLHGRQDERVLHELREWNHNYINVQEFMDNLAIARGRARSLTEELEVTQKQLHETSINREQLYQQLRKMMEKNSQQREKIVTLNEHINDLLNVKLERDELLQEKEELLEANKHFHLHTSELEERVDALAEENKVISMQREQIKELQRQVESLAKVQAEGGAQAPPSATPLPAETDPKDEEATDDALIPIPPPPPPIYGVDGIPVPPPLPPMGMPLRAGKKPQKIPVIPNVPLPYLNWITIQNPDYTIFKELDDESVMETVDFSEFETLFQVRRFKKSDKMVKREENIKKLSEQLKLIDKERARCLVIAKRRIVLTATQITEAILNTDLDVLLPEHCDLLLKFIPTEEELTKLAKNSHRFEEFAEADQYMYQLARIDRYESRLSAMAYMGSFDELMNSTQPQIDAVLSASLSICRCSRLRKIFEVILAFGNYMNSSKPQGAAWGFKLHSLSTLGSTKSLDRKQTLRHYIAHVVETVYPNVLSFYEDLDIEGACKVSIQLLAEDVKVLREGVKQIEFEKEKEPDNFILFSFYSHALRKVQHLLESYGRMEDAYRETCLMFDESPRTIEPVEFFGMFRDFIAEWQKAVKENHDSRRRRRIPGGTLLKKQSTEETRELMGELATEAAAAVAERAEHIRQETEQLARKTQKEPERPKRAQGEVVSSPEKEIVTLKDLKKRGVHRLDLKDRLPWLQVSAHEETKDRPEEAVSPSSEREVISPDSGVTESSEEGRMPELPPKDYPGAELPPKDYPGAELPPRDYPHGSQGGDMLGDNDYYSLLLSPLVD